jgi:hypothetical protein
MALWQLPSQDIFDDAMAFLDACEPEHLQILNVRTRQLQASGHDATERGREVMNAASQHPRHHLAWDSRDSPSESVAGPARSQAQDSLDRSLRSASHNVQVPQLLPAPGVSFGNVNPAANLSNLSLQLETRGQFQPQSPRALLGTSMHVHVYQHSGTLQPRLHGRTEAPHQTSFSLAASGAGASAGQINQPHVPAAAGGITGEGAPRAPRKRAILDPKLSFESLPPGTTLHLAIPGRLSKVSLPRQCVTYGTCAPGDSKCT